MAQAMAQAQLSIPLCGPASEALHRLHRKNKHRKRSKSLPIGKYDEFPVIAWEFEEGEEEVDEEIGYITMNKRVCSVGAILEKTGCDDLKNVNQLPCSSFHSPSPLTQQGKRNYAGPTECKTYIPSDNDGGHARKELQALLKTTRKGLLRSMSFGVNLASMSSVLPTIIKSSSLPTASPNNKHVAWEGTHSPGCNTRVPSTIIQIQRAPKNLYILPAVRPSPPQQIDRDA